MFREIKASSGENGLKNRKRVVVRCVMKVTEEKARVHSPTTQMYSIWPVPLCAQLYG